MSAKIVMKQGFIPLASVNEKELPDEKSEVRSIKLAPSVTDQKKLETIAEEKLAESLVTELEAHSRFLRTPELSLLVELSSVLARSAKLEKLAREFYSEPTQDIISLSKEMQKSE